MSTNLDKQCSHLLTDEIADEQDDELLDICDKFSKELTELNKFLNKSREKKLRKQIEIAGCSELGNIDDVWVFVVAGKDPKMIESINQEDPSKICPEFRYRI